MNLQRHVFVFAGMLSFASLSCFSQDAYLPVDEKEKKEIWFDRIISRENSGIVNGREYIVPFKGFKSDPFFQGGNSDMATVNYNGSTFRNVAVIYDVYNDFLILKYLNNEGSLRFIQLEKDLVNGFEINRHRFRKIDGRFCEILYEKKAFSLIAKRIKKTKLELGNLDYEVADQYYFNVGNQWIRIQGKKDLGKVLSSKENKRKLNSFMSDYHMRFNKMSDIDFQRVADYCYTLNHKTKG